MYDAKTRQFHSVSHASQRRLTRFRRCDATLCKLLRNSAHRHSVNRCALNGSRCVRCDYGASAPRHSGHSVTAEDSMAAERTWVRWGGQHDRHDVYERTDGRVICDTCKIVLRRSGAR